MMIIGCDFHSRFQQIALVDTETGEVVEKRVATTRGSCRGLFRETGPTNPGHKKHAVATTG